MMGVRIRLRPAPHRTLCLVAMRTILKDRSEDNISSRLLAVEVTPIFNINTDMTKTNVANDSISCYCSVFATITTGTLHPTADIITDNPTTVTPVATSTSVITITDTTDTTVATFSTSITTTNAKAIGTATSILLLLLLFIHLLVLLLLFLLLYYYSTIYLYYC